MTKKVKHYVGLKVFPLKFWKQYTLREFYRTSLMESGNCSEAKLAGLEKIHLSAAKLILEHYLFSFVIMMQVFLSVPWDELNHFF